MATAVQFGSGGTGFTPTSSVRDPVNNVNTAVQFGTKGTGFTPTGGTQMQSTTLNGTNAGTPSPTGGSAVSGYPVVTSKPATDNFNSIQQDYSQNIKPALQTSQANTQANSFLPVISGYNVSASPTGNQGETKATNQASGSSYYITPQNQSATANDVKNILSSPDTGAAGNSATTNGAPTVSTPAQQAQASTGTNPVQENASYTQNINQASDAITSAAQNYQSVLNTLSASSIPFTPAQQSLIDATNSAFQAMTTQTNLKAAALSSETGGSSDKVNALGGQLIGIATDQAAAIAKMEVGFQQENYSEKYQTITAAYSAYKDAEVAKMDALTKIHDSVMSTYQNAVQAAQAQQSFTQTQYKDAQTLAQSQYEFRDLKDAFGNTVGTQVYDKKTGAPVGNHYAAGQTDPSTGTTTPIVTADPNTGVVDQASQQAYLQTIPAAYRSLVQGIVNGKIEPPSARTAKGAQILSWVAGADPTLSDGSGGFDSTKYAARLTMQKSLANYSSGSYGSALISANKVVSHLASFLNSSATLPNAAVNPFNINKLASNIVGGIGALAGQTGIQSSQAESEQEARGLTDEMTKFFKGTGGTDVNSLESWGKSLNPNASAGTQHGVVQGTLNLFSGQLNSFINQYKSVMGHDPDLGTIIQPQTMQTLSAFKNAGYKIDIPGVYYTDKGSWQNNGGTQNQWNSAVDMLTTHGIPLTQENILQAAQVMNE